MKLQVKPVPDPAGLDEIILAAGRGVARFVERVASEKLGRPVNIWDGVNGLGAVLTEEIRAAGVPNKPLPELVTPRLVVAQIIGKPKRRQRRVK